MQGKSEASSPPHFYSFNEGTNQIIIYPHLHCKDDNIEKVCKGFIPINLDGSFSC